MIRKALIVLIFLMLAFLALVSDYGVFGGGVLRVNSSSTLGSPDIATFISMSMDLHITGVSVFGLT